MSLTDRVIDYGTLFPDLNRYFARQGYNAFMVRTALKEYLERFDDQADMKHIMEVSK